MLPWTSVPVILASLTFASCTYVTKSDTERFCGVGPRPVFTAIHTRTTAQSITTQKTAVFTFELMNSPSAGKTCASRVQAPDSNPHYQRRRPNTFRFRTRSSFLTPDCAGRPGEALDGSHPMP